MESRRTLSSWMGGVRVLFGKDKVSLAHILLIQWQIQDIN